MRIVCWQTILMKYHTLFFRKLRKMSHNLPATAVVIGASRAKQKVVSIPKHFACWVIFDVFIVVC